MEGFYYYRSGRYLGDAPEPHGPFQGLSPLHRGTRSMPPRGSNNFRRMDVAYTFPV